MQNLAEKLLRKKAIEIKYLLWILRAVSIGYNYEIRTWMSSKDQWKASTFLMGCLKWMTIGVLNTDKIEPRGAPFRRRCGSFTFKGCLGGRLEPFHCKRPVLTNLNWRISTKHVFSYKFRQKFDFSRERAKNVRFFTRANERFLSREQTIGPHRDTPIQTWKSSLYDKTNTWLVRLSALAQKCGRRIRLEPPNMKILTKMNKNMQYSLQVAVGVRETGNQIPCNCSLP